MDLAAFTGRTGQLDVTGIDFDSFRSDPLDEEVLRCLRYMHDVESHTICYLRDLLLTPSHQDPRITTFLTLWNFEEHWHGEALGRVLAAHDEAAGSDRIAPMRRRLGRRDQIKPLTSALAAALIGEDFVATHMAWGAINEWSTHAGYARLVERADHPVLSELLTRIMRQESRHVAFYAAEARTRLARSARARRVTRWALRRFWAPVGSGVMPPEESQFLFSYLLAGPAGQATVARIDHNIDRLPGLCGLDLMRRAAIQNTRAAEQATEHVPPRRSHGLAWSH